MAAYIEQLQGRRSTPSVKQQLAALRVLFDWLVVGQVVSFNPAGSLRGPRHSVRKGKTPILTAEEARSMLDAINITTSVGLRDWALIGVGGLHRRALRRGDRHSISRSAHFSRAKRCCRH